MAIVRSYHATRAKEGRKKGEVGSETTWTVRGSAERMMGYSGAEVARYLGVTISAVNRLVITEELPDLKQ